MPWRHCCTAWSLFLFLFFAGVTQVWLIEVNSNPCLELSSPYLSRIVPCLLEHTMQLTVDVSFPPQAPARSGGGTRSGMPSHEMIGAECGANRYLKVFES